MSGARRPRPLRDPWSAACALLAALVLAPCAAAAPAHVRAPTWSLPTLMSRIDGARVLIGGWSRRVQTASTLCSGEGRGRRWSGEGHWRHFLCTWTVFDAKHGVDRDVTFRVHTLGARRFLITSAHFGAS